jgi:hypothetical protein
MATILRYFISGANADWLDLGTPGSEFDLIGQQFIATGSATVNTVHAALGVDLDARNLLAGEDVIVFNYRWDQYTKDISSVSGAIVFSYLDSVSGLTEKVTVLNGATTLGRDKLVFADGAVLTQNAKTALTTSLSAALTTVTGFSAAAGSTTSTFVGPMPAGNTYRAFASTTNTTGQGALFAMAEAGQTLVATGSSQVDKVYVKTGAVVDARNLLAGEDVIYLTGNWGDYTKSLTAVSGAIQFTRTINGMNEVVTVLNGATTLGRDKLVFADGAVLTQNAKTALTTSLTAAITAVPAFDATTVTAFLSDIQAVAAVSSSGGVAGVHNAGDEIVFTVTMKAGKNVDVTTTGGTPRLAITLDSGATAYATFDSTLSGGTTNLSALKFKYVVAAGQTDSNGISLAANALSLNGGSIKLYNTATDAKIGTAALADQPSYKIDTTGPVVQSVTTNSAGTQVVLTYDEALDGANTPNASAFVVSANGASKSVTGLVVDAAAKTVTLSLSSAVRQGETITVAYSDPTNANDAVHDAAGTNAATLAARAVTNNSTVTNSAPTGSVSIAGTPEQGQTLTASNNLADADGMGTVAYQWKAAGVAIAGATASTLTLTEAQVGKTITVEASYTDGANKAETVSSAASVAVANVNDPLVGDVTISGIATQGQVLTASNNFTDADGMGSAPVAYQWKANGATIAGATASTYTLTESEVGKVITVVASYTDGHGTAESKTSTASTAVLNVNDAPTGSVTIGGGTVTQGQTLTVSHSLADLDGMGTVSYQWMADGNPISGATGTSYTLAEAEVGKAITVVASYTDGHGTAESKSSAATASVANVNDAPTPASGGVTISGGTLANGAPQQGDVLTAANTLADADGKGVVTYTWYADANTTPVATGGTLVMTEALVGKTIKVTASYIDGHGTAESQTSSATAAVANVNDAPAGGIAIVGTPTQGQTLTVSDTVTDADGKGTVTYSWYADAGTTAIATGASLPLTQAHVGKALSVKATYTDGHNTAELVSSVATLPVANIDEAATGALAVTGTAQEGGTLTASVAGLADADGSPTLVYQWQQKDGSNWLDMQAPGATLAIPSDQSLVGKDVRMVATSTDALGGKTLFTSSVMTVANVNDVPTGSVAIAGTANVGEVLTASNTLADGDGMGTVTYQWYAGSTAITGATGQTLTLGDAQQGQTITVNAAYTDGAGTSELVSSAATAAVGASTLQSTVVAADGGSYTASGGNVTYVIDATASMSATIGGFGVGDKFQILHGNANMEAGVSIGTGNDLILVFGQAVLTLKDAASSAFMEAAYADGGLSEADFLSATYGFGPSAIDYTASADTTPPTVSSITLSATGAQNDTINAGDVITATVTLSEPVVVTNTPQLGLTVGSVVVQASYVSGSSTNVLKFSYTVANGDVDANGVSIAADALVLNGGTIKDIAGNNLTPTHAAVSDVATLKVDTAAPVFTSGANATVAENAGFNQGVYTAAVSADAGVSYGLKAVGNVASLAIDSSTGVVSLKPNPDYETKSSYTFTVVATDAAGNVSENAVTLDVTNVNEAPTAVTLSNVTSSLPENTSTRLKVADIAVADPDATGNSNVITLTGADAAHFEVVSGVLYIKAGEVLNFEAKPSYAVTVSVADAGIAGSTPVTTSYALALTNVQETPTGAVSISGTATQGQTLTASNTIVDDDGKGAVSYQWLADGVVISGAAASTFTLTKAQVGKAISVVASYIDGLGKTESMTSAATGAVANLNDLPTGSVTISGTAKQGQTLTAANTLADADGMGTVSYQWKANGTSIGGATGSTYLLTESEVGKTITVLASYIDLSGTAESVASAATTAVINLNDAPQGSLSISGGTGTSGAPKQGDTLTVSTSALSDADGLGTFSYQWHADGNPISGATSASLALTQAQVGKLITVTASYTDGHGTAEAVTSAATVAVADVNDPPVNTVPATQSTNEDVAKVIASLSVADVDSTSLTVTLAVAHGTVSVLSGTGVTVATNGTGSVSLAGSPSNINALLATANAVTYMPTANYNGSDTLTVTTSDGSLSDVDTVGLTIAAVNDAPVNTVPAAQPTNEDVAKVIAGLGVADVDSASVTVTLAVAHGTVTVLSGTGVTVGTNGTGSVSLAGSPTNINALLATANAVTYTPTANYNGSDTLTVTTSDGSLSDVGTVGLTIAAVNDAPVNTVPAAQSTNEDVAKVIAGLGVADVDSASVTVTLAVAHGTVTVLSGTGVTVGTNGTGSVSLVGSPSNINTLLAAANAVTYTPAANYNGSDTLTMTTSDGSLSTVDTVTISIAAVNDAPTAANGTLTTAEDTALTLTAANFNFSDVDTGAALSKVQITTLPSVVALKLNGVDVTLNQEILVADITANKLVFTPAANANGAAYASIGFKVSDGMAYSVSANTLTVDVTAVNDAPTAANGTLTTAEDTALTLTVANFNFSDVDTGAALSKVQISTLPSVGALKLNGEDVTQNQEILVADITANKLVFTPAANANGAAYASIGFKVSDGMAYSVSANTLTVDVTAVNDAPTAENGTLTTAEDTALTLTAVNFNFSDVDTGAALSKVQITTLPSVGALKLNGVDVTQNQEILVADITANKLVFTPAENANGAAYASIGFKVSDGMAYSVSANTLTVGVTAVNDAPTVANPLADQSAGLGLAFSYVVPANAFADVDAGTSLTYTATQADGTALPSWLTFNAAARSFSGTPANADLGTLSVKVVASDGQLNVSDIFDVVVTDPNVSTTTTVANAGAYTATAGVNTYVIDASATISATISGFATGDVLRITNSTPAQVVHITDSHYGDNVSTVTVGNAVITLTNLVTDGFSPDETGFTGQFGANAIQYPPVFQSLAVHSGAAGAATIDMTYDHALDAAHPPAPEAFTVSINGTANAVDAVAISGSTVTLTLHSAVATGNLSVSVAYADPTAGNDANAIQDASGNDAASNTIVSGVVADGYIRGASVYIDTNGDGMATAADYFVGTTDAEGRFFIPNTAPSGNLVVTGGINIDTGILNTMTLRAPAPADLSKPLNINPLTTVIASMVSSTVTPAQAAAKVAAAFGLILPVGTDLLSIDPIAAASDSSMASFGLAVQKAAAQVATIVSLASSDSDATANAAVKVFDNIAAAVSSAPAQTTVNLTNVVTLGAVLNGAVGASSIASLTANNGALTSAVAAIQAASSVDTVSTAQSQVLDKIAPLAPTSLVGAASTNDTTPEVRVNFNVSSQDGRALVKGDTLGLYEGNTLLASVGLSAADIANGFVLISPASGLSQAGHSITAKATDAAGNVSPASAAIVVTVDTTAPTVTGVSDATTASVTKDPITFAVTFSEALATEPSTANFTATNGSVTSVSKTDSTHYTVVVTPSTNTASGTVALSLMGGSLKDAAGNAVVNANLGSLDSQDIDTVAPSATVSAVAFSADTGTSGTDFVTRTAAQTISGTLSAATATGEVVKVSLDNGTTWATATNTVGSTSFSYAGTLVGSNTLQVRVEDAAGNVGTARTQAYVLDTTAPTTTVNTVMFSADTGTSASDFITQTTAQTVSGTLSAGTVTGEVVKVSLDNGTTWATASNTVGSSNFSYAGTLADSNTMQVRVEDTAGNAATAKTQAYVLDTAAPVESLTAATLAPTGSAVVQSTEVGTAYLVKDSVAVSNLASITVAADNTWNSVAIDTANTSTNLALTGLLDGSYHLYGLDAAGNLSTISSNAVTVDGTAPTIAITSDKSSLTAGQTAAISFILSEVATDFVVGDVTVVGGTLSSFGGSGTSYSAIFTPTDNSTTAGLVSVASSKFSDAVGNLNADGSDANNTVALTINTVPAVASDVPVADNQTYMAGAGVDTYIIDASLTMAATISGFAAGDVLRVLHGSALQSVNIINKEPNDHVLDIAVGNAIITLTNLVTDAILNESGFTAQYGANAIQYSVLP